MTTPDPIREAAERLALAVHTRLLGEEGGPSLISICEREIRAAVEQQKERDAQIVEDDYGASTPSALAAAIRKGEV